MFSTIDESRAHRLWYRQSLGRLSLAAAGLALAAGFGAQAASAQESDTYYGADPGQRGGNPDRAGR